MAASNLSVSYSLQPPSSTRGPYNLSPITTHDFPFQIQTSEPSIQSASKAHYEALRDSIARAKEVTGRELTEWRDAVGDKEKDKISGKAVADDEIDEEIDEEAMDE